MCLALGEAIIYFDLVYAERLGYLGGSCHRPDKGTAFEDNRIKLFTDLVFDFL